MIFKCTLLKIQCLSLLLILAGCSGIQTFSSTMRAGETAVVAAGWKKNFNRDNLTVTITPSTGLPIVYLPGDPAVRAVINLYPDPLSSILVSERINENITPYAQDYATTITNIFTNGDKDWWQTSVFVDLPEIMPTGVATIDIANSTGDSVSSTVEIISGVGQPEEFNATFVGPLTSTQLSSMERIQHYVITLDGAVVPHAVQIDLLHDPDAANGGTGVPYVVNPRGEMKSISWNDDGNNLKIIIMPAHSGALTAMSDFKLYVAGGITNLVVSDVLAVDSNGNSISGIIAEIQAVN